MPIMLHHATIIPTFGTRARAARLSRSRKRPGHKRIRYPVLVFAAIVISLAFVPSLPAAEFSCGDPVGNPVTCLVNAINTANANGETNTIFLDAEGFFDRGEQHHRRGKWFALH